MSTFFSFFCNSGSAIGATLLGNGACFLGFVFFPVAVVLCAYLCTLLSCFLQSDKRLNVDLQSIIEQRWGRSVLWVLEWDFKSSEREKSFWQILQTWFFTPVCLVLWRRKFPRVLKYVSQASQWCACIVSVALRLLLPSSRSIKSINVVGWGTCIIGTKFMPQQHESTIGQSEIDGWVWKIKFRPFCLG